MLQWKLPKMSFRIFGLSLCLTVSAPTLASNSGIFNPSYESIEQEIVDLAEEYSDWVDHISYGTTNQGRKMHLLRIYNKSLASTQMQKRQAVYIDGVIHGNEYLHIEDRLARHFLENRDKLPELSSFLNNGGIIYIVPIFNPDGYHAHVRTNARGKDLNRDFPLQIANHRGKREVETKQFLAYIDQDLRKEKRKLLLSMNYHCCIGALLTPWSVDNIELSTEDFAAHAEIGKIAQETLGQDYKVGKTNDFLSTHAGTAKDYFYEHHHALAFTFEGKVNIEADNFTKHTEMWERIFEVLNRS